jgi:hypothetical protein
MIVLLQTVIMDILCFNYQSFFSLVTFSLERKSNQKVVHGSIVVFKSAYEIASLSSRTTRSLRRLSRPVP